MTTQMTEMQREVDDKQKMEAALKAAEQARKEVRQCLGDAPSPSNRSSPDAFVARSSNLYVYDIQGRCTVPVHVCQTRRIFWSRAHILYALEWLSCGSIEFVGHTWPL